MITEHPVRGVIRYADRRRQRRLSDDEYAALGRALAAAAAPPLPRKDGKPARAIWPAAVQAARFLALTGWRSGEALTLRWGMLDLPRRTARLGSAPGRGAARPDSGTSPAVPRVERTTQDRHTSGRQTDPTRSTLTAEPQGLLDRFAGRGQPVGSQRVGTPGSKERFDTGGEVIGIYRDPTTGRAAPTTRGIIHYSGRGAHIVPARPNGWSNQ